MLRAGTVSRLRLLVAILMALFTVSPVIATSLASTPLEWNERPDDELYVFGLTLDGYVLTDGFIVFYDGTEVFVPLTRITELLEFPIEVDPVKGIASGWFINDDRTFHLDLQTGMVKLNERAFQFKSAHVERHADDLYVALSALEKWFPLILEIRFSNLQIAVKALTLFPLQARIAREKRRSRLAGKTEAEKLDVLMPDNDWFELPFVDISINASSRKTDSVSTGQILQTMTAAGIFAGLDGETTLITNSATKSPNVRLRLGRHSVYGGLLGPLDAHEFSVGDIATTDLPLVANNTAGRGLSFSSYDLTRLAQTNRVTLRGELSAGWEVEVYRNSELIDFQTGSDIGNGRYEFSNVPTVSGLNEFRLVFYGPQGQMREKFERYFVTSALAAPQQVAFRFAINQANRDLISFADQKSTQVDNGKNRLVAQAEYGINPTFSVTGGLASLSVDGERYNYVSSGIRTSLFGVMTHLNLSTDDEGGFALGGRAHTRWGSWSLSGEQTWYRDFRSEQVDNSSVSGHLRSTTMARINGNLPNYGLGEQPLSASVTHRTWEYGQREMHVFGRISSVIKPFNFALSANTRISNTQQTQRDARLLISTLVGNFLVRGEAIYKIAPVTTLERVSLNTNWHMKSGWGARHEIAYQAGDKSLSLASIGLNRQFDKYAMGVNLTINNHGNYSAQLGLSFSFGHNPMTNRIVFRGKPFAQRSAVGAQVFLDRDNDGVYGANDKIISNAGFSGNSVPLDIKTSEDGSAFIVGLSPYEEIEIGLDEGTLEDPFWISSEKSKNIIMRPGTTNIMRFPVIETGEVDGLVILIQQSEKNKEGSPIEQTGAGINVFLMNLEGDRIAETTSAYDGFFIFERIPYGQYEVALDNIQLEDIGYTSKGLTRKFVINNEMPFTSVQDMVAVPIR